MGYSESANIDCCFRWWESGKGWGGGWLYQRVSSKTQSINLYGTVQSELGYERGTVIIGTNGTTRNWVRGCEAFWRLFSIHEQDFSESHGNARVIVIILCWSKPTDRHDEANSCLPLGRPRRRWEDNIRMDLQVVGLGYEDWIGLAQDRDRWRALVSAVRNLRAP